MLDGIVPTLSITLMCQSVLCSSLFQATRIRTEGSLPERSNHRFFDDGSPRAPFTLLLSDAALITSLGRVARAEDQVQEPI
jgi:hypothetical protein